MLNARNKKLNRIRMNSDTTHYGFLNLNQNTNAFNSGINLNSGENSNMSLNNINNKTVVLTKNNTSNMEHITQSLFTLKSSRDRARSNLYKQDEINKNFLLKNIKKNSEIIKNNYQIFLANKKVMKKSKSFDNFIIEKHKQNFVVKISDTNKKKSNFYKIFSHFFIDPHKDKLTNKKVTKLSIKYYKKNLIQDNQKSDLTQFSNHYKKLNFNYPSKNNSTSLHRKNNANSEVKKKSSLSQNSNMISHNEKGNLKSNIIDINKYNFKNISPFRNSSQVNSSNLNYANKLIFKLANVNIEKNPSNYYQTNNDAHNTNDNKKTSPFFQSNLKNSNLKVKDGINSTERKNSQLLYSKVGFKFTEKEEKDNVSKIIDRLLITGPKIKNNKEENNNKQEKDFKTDPDLIKINLPNNLKFKTLESKSNKSPKNYTFNKLENTIDNIINKKIQLKSDTVKLNIENTNSSLAIKNYEAFSSEKRNVNNIVNKINSFPTNYYIKKFIDECNSNNIKVEKKFEQNKIERNSNISDGDSKDKIQKINNNINISAKNYLSNSSNNILKEYMQNTKMFLSKKNISTVNSDNSSYQISSSIYNQPGKILENSQSKNEQNINNKSIIIKNQNSNLSENEEKFISNNEKNDKIDNNLITNLSYDMDGIIRKSPELRRDVDDCKMFSRKNIINEEAMKTVLTPHANLDNDIKIEEFSDLPCKIQNKIFSPFIKPKFISDAYLYKQGESTPEDLINKPKSKIIEKFFTYDMDDEKMESRPKITISTDFYQNKKSGFKEILTERKTIKMINNTIQLNNFQQIINNNLTYFNSNCSNSKNNNNNKNILIEDEKEEKFVNRNDVNSMISGNNKIIIKGSNLSSILNKSKERIIIDTKDFVIPNNEVINKNYYVNTNSTITTVNENIFDKTLLIDNKKLDTQKDLLLSHDSLSLGKSDDECTFSGDEKAQITSVPLFNNKKLESYNFSSNRNLLSKLPSSKKIVYDYVKMETFSGLIKYNSEIKENILGFLNNQDLLNLSLTSRQLRNEIKNKISSNLLNLILNENNSINRIKIWHSIFKYSPLSKAKFLKKEYLDYLYLKSPYEEDIKKDLNRTFPDDPTFKQGKMNYRKLFNILISYSNYNPNVGYAQGLNFIVGNSIFIMKDEEEIFLFIDGLINKYDFQNLIGIDNSMLSKKLEDIGQLLKIYTPELVSFLDQYMLNHEFFTANWLITIFSNSVKRIHVFKIWDFFLIYGWKFLHFFIVTILKTFLNEIIKYDPCKLSTNIKLLLKSDIFDQSFKQIIVRTMEMINTY